MSNRLLADIRPLKTSRDYRRLWLGSSLSAIGGQMTVFAVALQVYLLTHSSAAVGGIGLAQAVPAIVVGLFGGAVIDAVDRRRLVLLTSALLAVCSAAFAVQAFAHNTSVWLLYVLVAVESALAAVNAPARRTFMPRLLPPDQVPAALALTMFSMHASLVIGPALAGVITGAGGLKLCYVIDAASFVGALYGVLRLPPMRPEGVPTRPGLRSVVDGLAFVGRSRVLTGVLLADISATLLAMPIALFPAINAERFGGSARTLGLLSAAVAAGGILGTVFSGPASRVRHQGLGVLVAGAVWGAALAGFGAVQGLALTLAFLALAGIADVTSVVLRSTIVQVATPDAYRGRVSSTEFVVGAAFPQLGNFRAGVVASWTSPNISATSGGVAAVAGAAVIALALPALVRYVPETVSDLPALR